LHMDKLRMKVLRCWSSSRWYRRTRRRPSRVASGVALSTTAAEAASSGRRKELRAPRRVPSGEHPGSGTKASWRDESVPRHRLVVK
jgi:hypothetical protein